MSSAYASRYVLALVRVLAAFSLNPLLGGGRVPMPARVGLGFFVTLVLFPPGGPIGPEVRVGPIEVAAEVLVGLLAGFAVTLVFATAQITASLIGVNSGFSLASVIDPSFDGGIGVLERFFSAFALLVFVQINGHHLFLIGLRELFEVVDVGAVTLIPETPDRLAALSAGMFVAAVKMALPVLAALLLADLALAILARVAPQFNLLAIGLPAKMAIGLAALAVALPILAPKLAALFRALPSQMIGLAS